MYSSQAGYFLAGPQLHQAGDSRLDEIDRIAAAMHLGQDVADAAHFQDIADAWTGLDAGARASRHQDNAAATELTDDTMGDRVAAQRYALGAFHRFLRVLGGFFDGGWHFIGLAVAGGDTALVVADDDQGVEAKAPPALDHSGAATNLHHAIFQPIRAPFATFSGHVSPLRSLFVCAAGGDNGC